MGKRRKPREKSPPKVRIAKPSGRPIQLRYYCPSQKREVRISTNSYDEVFAEQERQKLQARLVLGIEDTRNPRAEVGPEMSWNDFREMYRVIQLSTLEDASARHAESRLDIAERILSPRTLGDVANAESIHLLQSQLLAGAETRFRRPRSPHTVKSHITSLLAAINWAVLQGWLESAPKIRKVRTGKLKKMKGRPITEAEFDQLLDAVPGVVGQLVADSWTYVLRGLWESGLRISEIMHLSWDDANMIRPLWPAGKLSILSIPSAMQKNAVEEDIPMLPGFEQLLLETRNAERTGWVFSPKSLQTYPRRQRELKRGSAEWVGKVVSRIGRESGVIVAAENQRTNKPAKYASAHDLRRSRAELMMAAGLPPEIIRRVMRHASWETTLRHYLAGDVQRDAAILREKLEMPS